MSITFTCSSCNRASPLTIDWQASEGKCKSCGSLIKIPEPSSPQPAGCAWKTSTAWRMHLRYRPEGSNRVAEGRSGIRRPCRRGSNPHRGETATQEERKRRGAMGRRDPAGRLLVPVRQPGHLAAPEAGSLGEPDESGSGYFHVRHDQHDRRGSAAHIRLVRGCYRLIHHGKQAGVRQRIDG